MARRARARSEHGWYHVMNRGVDRQDVFFDDVDRVDFGAVLGAAHERAGVDVHAYCLMPNHFHLLVHDPVGTLAGFMHHVGTTYTRHLNDRLDRDGPVFRGRFRSVPVASEPQLLRTLRYIHRNPAELVGVADIDGFRWSSHRTYLGARRRPAWLTIDTLLDRFDDVAHYRAFVVGADPADWPAFDDASVAAVTEIVAAQYADAAEHVVTLLRTLCVGLADRHPQRAATLEGWTVGLSPGAVRTARSRARDRLRHDRRARAMLVAAEALLLGSDPSSNGQSTTQELIA